MHEDRVRDRVPDDPVPDPSPRAGPKHGTGPDIEPEAGDAADTASRVRLHPDEVEHFREQGYLVPAAPVFAPPKFERLLHRFEAALAAWPADRRPERMDTPHFADHRLLEWALAPEVVDLVEPLVGPDIVLFSTHFICKPAGDGFGFNWHEDAVYWRGMITPLQVVTVWLALDPSTVDTGCMYFAPGSHRRAPGVSARHWKGRYGAAAVGVPVELAPNHCSIHHARMIHRSPVNHSAHRRCGWSLRYAPAHCRLDPAQRARHLMYLARGRNLLDQPLADPTRDYPEVVAERERTTVRL